MTPEAAEKPVEEIAEGVVGRADEGGGVMAEIDDRVLQFKTLRLPGQPMTMHIGTSNLVGDLDRQRLDLLDALRRIMTYAHDGAAVRDIDTTEQPEFVAARAAIAKAEGR